MTKNCNSCWWYCHSDGRCFRTAALKGVEAPKIQTCNEWAFDGLEDWEREDSDALVTMEMTR